MGLHLARPRSKCKFGFQYITSSVGFSYVASEEQTQDFDTYHICMCWDCGNNAIHNQLSEARLGLAPSGSGWL
ncbi:unnamed protein product [Withania somnifera]